jgi:hypothetical protein
MSDIFADSFLFTGANRALESGLLLLKTRLSTRTRALLPTGNSPYGASLSMAISRTFILSPTNMTTIIQSRRRHTLSQPVSSLNLPNQRSRQFRPITHFDRSNRSHRKHLDRSHLHLPPPLRPAIQTTSSRLPSRPSASLNPLKSGCTALWP